MNPDRQSVYQPLPEQPRVMDYVKLAGLAIGGIIFVAAMIGFAVEFAALCECFTKGNCT